MAGPRGVSSQTVIDPHRAVSLPLSLPLQRPVHPSKAAVDRPCRVFAVAPSCFETRCFETLWTAPGSEEPPRSARHPERPASRCGEEESAARRDDTAEPSAALPSLGGRRGTVSKTTVSRICRSRRAAPDAEPDASASGPSVSKWDTGRASATCVSVSAPGGLPLLKPSGGQGGAAVQNRRRRLVLTPRGGRFSLGGLTLGPGRGNQEQTHENRSYE